MKFDREKVTCAFSSVMWGTYERNARHIILFGVRVPLTLIREMAKMCTDLSSPNLDDIKKEARDLLHALQRGDAAALSRYYSINFLSFNSLSQPRLVDAQYIIAREHGYSSWLELTEHIETLISSRNC
jgi:hypothetical protein